MYTGGCGGGVAVMFDVFVNCFPMALIPYTLYLIP